jgi:dihydrofolate reductase
MGLLTFSINVTLDGCVDHQEGIADDETHAFFTRLMDEGGAMLWGRVTYEMMESYWPAVARGDVEASPALREWAVKLEAKPKYVVSSTRKDFPWTNSHHLAGDLRTGVQKLKDATPAGVLLGSGKLATELDRLDLIDEYKFLVHPRIAGHGPTLYQSGLPEHATARVDLGEAASQRRGRHALPARALIRRWVMSPDVVDAKGGYGYALLEDSLLVSEGGRVVVWLQQQLGAIGRIGRYDGEPPEFAHREILLFDEAENGRIKPQRLFLIVYKEAGQFNSHGVFSFANLRFA